MCARPFRQGVAEYGCGQCLPCRMNRKRLWVSRLMLEAQLHSQSLFVTLTYSPENLPAGGSVQVRDAQLFLKRLRSRVAPVPVRYFIVGEYGSHTWRPHYHAVLFGAVDLDAVVSAWGLGHVHIGNLTPQSAAYTVSYAVKRLSRVGDPRLDGRAPEFARMSLKPGIGAGAMAAVGDAVVSRGGARFVAESGDVPSVVRSGQLWPLGRYLRRKLREEVGSPPECPAAALEALARQRQGELVVPGARQAREVKREAVALRAAALNQISESKRGIGV